MKFMLTAANLLDSPPASEVEVRGSARKSTAEAGQQTEPKHADCRETARLRNRLRSQSAQGGDIVCSTNSRAGLRDRIGREVVLQRVRAAHDQVQQISVSRDSIDHRADIGKRRAGQVRIDRIKTAVVGTNVKHTRRRVESQ